MIFGSFTGCNAVSFLMMDNNDNTINAKHRWNSLSNRIYDVNLSNYHPTVNIECREPTNKSDWHLAITKPSNFTPRLFGDKGRTSLSRKRPLCDVNSSTETFLGKKESLLSNIYNLTDFHHSGYKSSYLDNLNRSHSFVSSLPVKKYCSLGVSNSLHSKQLAATTSTSFLYSVPLIEVEESLVSLKKDKLSILSLPVSTSISDSPPVSPMTNIEFSHTPHSDQFFSVQTPTKAIGESDLLSFHLVSPPSVLPTLTSGSGTKVSGRVTQSNLLKPRVLFPNFAHNQGTLPIADIYDPPVVYSIRNVNPSIDQSSLPPSKLLVRSMQMRESSMSKYNSSIDRAIVPSSKQLVRPMQTKENFTDHPKITPISMATSSNVLSQPPSFRSGSDSIAFLTAKATIWNRMLKIQALEDQKSENRIHQNTPSHITPYSAHSREANRYYKTSPPVRQRPSVNLNVPPNKEPHLSIRRILQIGFEAKWRRLAYGESRLHQISVCMARQVVSRR